ncbi:MAG: helix-turn-helix domain-containing protein [Myxococcales bacterium]
MLRKPVFEAIEVLAVDDVDAALERGDASVGALAAELGYADQAHFCRDFKRVVGVAPSRYAARLVR